MLMYFKINNKNVETIQFEKKEPICVLLHTKNPRTKEKKLFAIVEGTL